MIEFKPGFRKIVVKNALSLRPAGTRFLPARQLFVLFALLMVHSATGKANALPDVRGLPPAIFPTAVADFDRDGLPDIAILTSRGYGTRGYVYQIELQLSSKPERALLSIESRWRFGIAAMDIDQDHDADLVLTSWGHAVAVWINNGQGVLEPGDIRLYPAISWNSRCEAFSQTSTASDQFARIDRRFSFACTGRVISPRQPETTLPAEYLSDFAAPRLAFGVRNPRAPPQPCNHQLC